MEWSWVEVEGSKDGEEQTGEYTTKEAKAVVEGTEWKGCYEYTCFKCVSIREDLTYDEAVVFILKSKHRNARNLQRAHGFKEALTNPVKALELYGGNDASMTKEDARSVWTSLGKTRYLVRADGTMVKDDEATTEGDESMDGTKPRAAGAQPAGAPTAQARRTESPGEA